jgi:hypothetical protein
MVTLYAQLEGIEEVKAGFGEIGAASTQMGQTVQKSSRGMQTSYRSLMLQTAGLMMNTMQLGTILSMVAKGQMDVGRGALMMGMNLLQLASNIWMVVGAEHARAVAHGIANALMGPAGWVILAGAAAAVVGALALSSQIPRKQIGGLIQTSGPYHLEAGERVIPRGGSTITFNIYGGQAQQVGDEVERRLRRMGIL